MMVNILLIAGWVLSLWGLYVLVLDSIGIFLGKTSGPGALNILWGVLGLIFVVWRLFPNFQF
jgi:hypothetical protein